jgi:hypothetical protein
LRLAPPRMWMRFELAAKHALSRLVERGGVAGGETLEDEAGKDRLVAGVRRDGRVARRAMSSLLMRSGMLESSMRVSASTSSRPGTWKWRLAG